jgi:hypothetical protein
MITGLSYASYFGRSTALILPLAFTTSGVFMIFAAISSQTHFLAEGGALLLAVGLLGAFLHSFRTYRNI